MTSENFCYWLQGYLDKPLSKYEIEKIRQTLRKVDQGGRWDRDGLPIGGGMGACNGQTQPQYGGAGGVDAYYGKPSSSGVMERCKRAKGGGY